MNAVTAYDVTMKPIDVLSMTDEIAVTIPTSQALIRSWSQYSFKDGDPGSEDIGDGGSAGIGEGTHRP